MATREEAIAYQKSLTTHALQWATRRENVRDQNIRHCVCVSPTPTGSGFWLTAMSTVQCDRCGRAIFDNDGAPIRSVYNGYNENLPKEQ